MQMKSHDFVAKIRNQNRRLQRFNADWDGMTKYDGIKFFRNSADWIKELIAEMDRFDHLYAQ